MIDPASGTHAPRDVGVRGGRVAAIEASLDAARAGRVIDARGLLVTAGLVDLHVHVFAGEEPNHFLAHGHLAVRADDVAPSACTTTVVDAGSSGSKSFALFRETAVAPSKTRVLAWLNIVGEGMRGGRFEQDLGDMDEAAAVATIRENPRVIVGLKVAHYAGPGWEPIDRAVRAARATGTRVMIDFGGHTPPLPLDELLLRRLGPGDMLTHAFAEVPGRTAIVDAAGALRPYVVEARARGVRFDVGYGGKSFSFRQAAAAGRAGFWPDTASTDAHRASVRGSMHDLPRVLSKLDALGMPLDEVIRSATVAAADAIGRADLGRLAVGAEADVALLELAQGAVTFHDATGAALAAKRELRCALTLRAGEIVFDRDHRAH
ncbi:MAG TPA: amidohydrolase/deacetylase family metallohydrolase [Byssovorax sp.]